MSLLQCLESLKSKNEYIEKANNYDWLNIGTDVLSKQNMVKLTEYNNDLMSELGIKIANAKNERDLVLNRRPEITEIQIARAIFKNKGEEYYLNWQQQIASLFYQLHIGD